MVRIITMGDGAAASLTLGAIKALSEAPRAILQTGTLPCAKALSEMGIAFDTLDGVYESAEDFDELTSRAAGLILEGDCVFAAIGPLHLSGIVRAVLAGAQERGIAVEIMTTPADRALTAAGGGDALILPAQGLELTGVDTSRALLLTELYSPYLAAELSVPLLELYGDGAECFVVTGGEVKKVAVGELSRCTFDHASCVAFPAKGSEDKPRHTVADLERIMKRLRAPGGCPWDAEQTHESLKKYLLEESYEAVSAIDAGNTDALCDELGDVLLQIVFHARIGEERGEFTLTDIATAVCQKMIHRHPHVFGEVSVTDSGEVLKNWDAIKRNEKGMTTYSDELLDVPLSMSALMRSQKVQKRAAKAGFDWTDINECAKKVGEEAAELAAAAGKGERRAVEEEMGDLFFALINVARHLDVDAETALAAACDKFIARFCAVEKKCAELGEDMGKLSPERLDGLWRAVKSEQNENFEV